MSNGVARAIPPAVMAAFRCPQCREAGRSDPDGIRCPVGHLTRHRHGYLDASTTPDGESRRTFDSFGYEWARFSNVNPEDETFWRRYFADVDLSLLAGRLGLDAGCGKGRYSRFTAPYLGALVASDGSDASRVAATNLADLPNVCVMKADLRTMPFATGSFDFISCLGVLHHLPEPGAGLDALADLLAPEGLLLAYLYSRPERSGLRSWSLAAAGRMRCTTVKMPRAILRPLCWPLAAALYGAFVIPGALGQRLPGQWSASIPLATYRGSPLRSLWLDTFDRLSAPLEARFTPTEARAMFAHCALSVVALRTDPQLAGIVVLAKKETQ